jgi:outer membrane protein assembly factor BamB
VPLVWKDMIFIGKAGGELGIRGEMMAFRAADGTKIWGFHTIPSSGETGSETWKKPRQHRAWRRSDVDQLQS